MNLEQPPPPPPPPRLSTCNLHPDQPFTGFCAACLRERLAGLEAASNRNPQPSSASSSAASALKAIFRSTVPSDAHRLRPSAAPAIPELRRSKSFSGARADGIPVSFEPQRKSCDVRVRNTLWSLFHQDDESRCRTTDPRSAAAAAAAAATASTAVECRNVNSALGDEIVEEEGEIEEETRTVDFDEIEEEAAPVDEEVKTIKDHIEVDGVMKDKVGERRDLKEIAGSFWVAASVFSKRLRKWRRKKKRSGDDAGDGTESVATTVRMQKRGTALSSRHFRETQSEVADYGYGRRSCDTDPRFSLDAGRISFDDARYSFDEPRASWDGYLIGGRGVGALPRIPAMGPVVEDAPGVIRRSDAHIPVEEPMNSISEDPMTPGGSAQTRDYYMDSPSQRRRPSLDRSSSVRKGGAVGIMALTADEVKSISNSKVSPASMDYFPKIAAAPSERDFRDSNSTSLRDDCSESFESAYRDSMCPQKGLKKSRRWSKAWSIWGLIYRRGGGKDDEDERYSGRGNVVDRSFSESWPELRRETNGIVDPRVPFNRKIFRSNSSVSLRNACVNGGLAKNCKEMNGQSKKRREEFVLDRNRSARYSPSHIDNGLLRFYLTPLRSSRRGGGASGKNRSRNGSQSFTRSMLRLY